MVFFDEPGVIVAKVFRMDFVLKFESEYLHYIDFERACLFTVPDNMRHLAMRFESISQAAGYLHKNREMSTPRCICVNLVSGKREVLDRRIGRYERDVLRQEEVLRCKERHLELLASTWVAYENRDGAVGSLSKRNKKRERAMTDGILAYGR